MNDNTRTYKIINWYLLKKREKEASERKDGVTTSLDNLRLSRYDVARHNAIRRKKSVFWTVVISLSIQKYEYVNLEYVHSRTCTVD